MSILTDPIYSNEDAARAYLEAQRWPDGPFCPYCGAMGNIGPLGGNSMGPGWYYCGDCFAKFTVRVGSIFERSHVPLHKWLLAFRLLCGSKKGMSSHQLHRTLEVTYKTAWFMSHRIREAMRSGSFSSPLGGAGKTVEADETYHGKRAEQPTETTSGRKFTKRGGAARAGKRSVVALVERGGSVRTFHVKEHPTAETVTAIIRENVSPASTLHTDESRLYPPVGAEMAGHETVHHSSGEYVRGDVHTNTVEGFFSIFKRGMNGVYQHCSERHLHRYLDEFSFRYSARVALGIDDTDRTVRAIKGAGGKRLTYRQPGL